jgi:hypothetical protein
VRAVLANLLAWLGGFLLSWLVYAQFDTQIGRAGIYALALTSCGILMILYSSQRGEWLHGLNLRTSLYYLAGTLLFVAIKGFVDLLLAGKSTPTVANIQIAMDKGGRWGMLLTLTVATIFVTGFFMTSLRMLLRRKFGIDSGGNSGSA